MTCNQHLKLRQHLIEFGLASPEMSDAELTVIGTEKLAELASALTPMLELLGVSFNEATEAMLDTLKVFVEEIPEDIWQRWYGVGPEDGGCPGCGSLLTSTTCKDCGWTPTSQRS